MCLHCNYEEIECVAIWELNCCGGDDVLMMMVRVMVVVMMVMMMMVVVMVVVTVKVVVMVVVLVIRIPQPSPRTSAPTALPHNCTSSVSQVKPMARLEGLGWEVVAMVRGVW